MTYHPDDLEKQIQSELQAFRQALKADKEFYVLKEIMNRIRELERKIDKVLLQKENQKAEG